MTDTIIIITMLYYYFREYIFDGSVGPMSYLIKLS